MGISSRTSEDIKLATLKGLFTDATWGSWNCLQHRNKRLTLSFLHTFDPRGRYDQFNGVTDRSNCDITVPGEPFDRYAKPLNRF